MAEERPLMPTMSSFFPTFRVWAASSCKPGNWICRQASARRGRPGHWYRKKAPMVMQLQAMVRELCPRCHQGKLFRGPLWRTYLAMYERCPKCHLKYEREQGYFLGAMYFSYMLSVPPVLVLVLLLWWLTSWRFDVVIVAAFVAYLPLVPIVTRFARVLWLYVDRHFDPDV